MDSACVQADLRRLMAAQLALLFGSADLKDRLGRLLEGELGEDEAQSVRTDLDTMAGLLLG